MAEETEGTANEKSSLSESDRIKLLSEEYLKDLNENPKYKDFFEQFNASSVELFKESYAKDKADIAVRKEYFIHQCEDNESTFSVMASRLLWQIQQRKLFDLQCLWRAEQIEIPEITVSEDFKVQSENIEHCPFLPPITQIEYDRYISFLEQADFDDLFTYDRYFSDWQNYDDFKDYAADIESEYIGDEPPEWYQYYELVTGLSTLYNLPDIKGGKERKYADLARERDRKLWEEKNKNKQALPPDTRPRLDFFDREMKTEFIKRFEDYKTQYTYECNDTYYSVYDDRDLDDAIETLHLADRTVYLDPTLPWRESIIASANNYSKQRIIEAFPGVYKNYLFRIENHLEFEKKQKSMPIYLNSSEILKGLILDGREILGEPRDFNY